MVHATGRGPYYSSPLWSCLVTLEFLECTLSKKESCMYEVLNEVYLENLFRDRYNLSGTIIWGTLT